MNCVICREGERQPGETTVTLERGGAVLIFRKVPAQVCANCGEPYLDDAVSEKLLKTAEEAARSGVLVQMRCVEYPA